MNPRSIPGIPVLMWCFLALFVARVLGQIYVGLYSPGCLPPWEEWYSGILPYPLLLPAQHLILMWMTLIAYDVTRGAGFFVLERPGVVRGVDVFSRIYASGMVARYVVTMWQHPERRWLEGTLPIWFHLVLAGFLFLWSRDGVLRDEIDGGAAGERPGGETALH